MGKGWVHIRKSKSGEKLNEQFVNDAYLVLMYRCCASKSVSLRLYHSAYNPTPVSAHLYATVRFCTMNVHWSVKDGHLESIFAEIDAVLRL